MNIALRNRVVEEHYREHYEVQVIKLRGRLGARADDAVQEAYLRALQYWDSFDSELGSFEEWFSRILNNSISDEFIDTQRNGITDKSENLTTPATQYTAMRLEDISKLLAGRPPNLQRCLRMALVDRYTPEEISKILPFSISNIRKIVQRFRDSLKTADV